MTNLALVALLKHTKNWPGPTPGRSRPAFRCSTACRSHTAVGSFGNAAVCRSRQRRAASQAGSESPASSWPETEAGGGLECKARLHEMTKDRSGDQHKL